MTDEPVAYLTPGPLTAELGVSAPLVQAADALLYAFTATNQAFTVVEGEEGDGDDGCVLVLTSDLIGASEHPVGSYNVLYPYTRTAVRVWINDPKPLAQIAQLVSQTRYLIIQLRVVDDDEQPVAVAASKITVEPPQLYPCAVELYDYFVSSASYPSLVVDTNFISLPARINLTITDTLGRSRAGWIGLRETRVSAPSGSVI